MSLFKRVYSSDLVPLRDAIESLAERVDAGRSADKRLQAQIAGLSRRVKHIEESLDNLYSPPWEETGYEPDEEPEVEDPRVALQRRINGGSEIGQ